MTVWSLRMLSRPELAFIGPEVSSHLLGWIDTAVAAQEAVDHARKVVQTKAQSAASRFAGRTWSATAGRFPPLTGGRQSMEHTARPDNQHGHARDFTRPDGMADQSGGNAVRRRSRWLFGRGR